MIDTLFRRACRLLEILPAMVALAAAALPMQARAFDFSEVAARAQQLAGKNYQEPKANLPKELQELNYDQYRDIRFKPDRSLWHDKKLPFELQFFHPGLYYNHPVGINLVVNGKARALIFNPANFDYGKNTLDRNALTDIGYAGFRVHFPINNKQYKDEILVFQGASYFRALGKGQHYGLSARGLAVDTAQISGEEFPSFTEFWVEQPQAKSTSLVIWALLDSRRVTGAYQFTVKPGDETRMEVRARLFLRENVAKLGIAPLTSMFNFAENQAARTEDYRSEVHDSDGLQILAENGERIWRPLVNPRRLLVTSFGLTNPRGFGLMQRDRDFGHYEDLEARYEQRPSAWVTPKGDWGAGRVELVQIPTPDETNDNIVAYWVPDRQPDPGKPLDLQYTVAWQKDSANKPALARVVQTRRGHGYIKTPDDSIRLIVDFEGEALAKLGADAKLMPGLWVGDNGEILERQLFRHDVTGGWRLSIRLRRAEADKPVELRATLRDTTGPVSETWSYILPGE
jgi:glucans biosynthesis protein